MDELSSFASAARNLFERACQSVGTRASESRVVSDKFGQYFTQTFGRQSSNFLIEINWIRLFTRSDTATNDDG